jgi:hypothetical protein
MLDVKSFKEMRPSSAEFIKARGRLKPPQVGRI